MAPLFSKDDLNKLWHDVQNEATLMSAKFGKDLFNISKVVGRKTKWPRFFGLPCIFMNDCGREVMKRFVFSKQQNNDEMMLATSQISYG